MDRQLQSAAEEMIAAAERGRSVVAVLKSRCPAIYRQICQDRQRPELLALWGRAVNVDENAGKVIVHPAILKAIGELAGLPPRGQFVHAGLQHTYGYLFSLIDTPYGRKRARWLSTGWERGFDIDETLLGEQPKAGTLLANLTWFIGKIVFRGRNRQLRQLERNSAAVAPELVGYDFDSLPASRIEEQATLAKTRKRTLQLFTDLVPYPYQPADADAENELLIYSVQSGLRGPIKLVTSFPVRPATVRTLKRGAAAADKVKIRLRYNAYVPGWHGRAVLGRRFMLDLPPQNVRIE
jgi:hypothetical protein